MRIDHAEVEGSQERIRVCNGDKHGAIDGRITLKSHEIRLNGRSRGRVVAHSQIRVGDIEL